MKKEYETPKIIEHGDVKEITLANGTDFTSMDAQWTDTAGIGHATYNPVGSS